MDRDDAIAATAPFVDDAARDTIVVTGADAQSYLQSQLSQEIGDLAVGSARWTFALEPNGKVAALARLRRAGDDRFELDTDAGFGEALRQRLDRFRIRVDVATELVPAERPGPDAAHEAARIAGGWPRMGAEIEPGATIPATTGVIAYAVDFRKGCYPGQELVERMDSRGADAPRTLRILDAAPGGSLTVGAAVVDDAGDEVGTITSVAPDGAVAIAVVRRGADVGRAPDHAD